MSPDWDYERSRCWFPGATAVKRAECVDDDGTGPTGVSMNDMPIEPRRTFLEELRLMIHRHDLAFAYDGVRTIGLRLHDSPIGFVELVTDPAAKRPGGEWLWRVAARRLLRKVHELESGKSFNFYSEADATVSQTPMVMAATKPPCQRAMRLPEADD